MGVSRVCAFDRLVTGLAGGLCLLALAGCNTASTPSSGAVRNTSQTAPTDLQLLCASTAAQQLNVPGGNVLPVSSMPAGDNAFQVNLTYEGGQAVCTIDNAGVISSIDRV